MPLPEAIFFIATLLIAAVAVGLFCRRIPVPFTVLLVIIGMGMGAMIREVPELAILSGLQLSPELVLFVFLPALIFESGFSLDGRQLLKDLIPILALAVPALLLSTLLIGGGLWWLLAMDPVMALLFGALISATDPIAVVALFREIGAPLRLTVLVEGESLFNDATALVVFKILLAILLVGVMPEQTWLHIATNATGAFLKVFIGGAAFGIFVGFVASEMMRRLNSDSAIMAVSVAIAYLAFVTAEHFLHLSGVMAVVTSALVIGTWGRTRIPQHVARALGKVWGMIAYICNALLFLLVGISISLPGIMAYLPAILIAILLVLVVRAATIYSLVPATTFLFKLPTIGMNERHIMWWGGLKGGLAIAIVLSIPEDLAGREMLLHMTVGVVLFTLVVNASTISRLMRWLGMNRLSREEHAEVEHATALSLQQAEHALSKLQHFGLISHIEHSDIQRDMEQQLHHVDQVSQRDLTMHLQLTMLRIEMERLDELFTANVIPQQTLLELRLQVQHKRDMLCQGLPYQERGAATPLRRIEQGLIRRLREQDWLASLLSRYQQYRLTQKLYRKLARTLMIEAALADIKHDIAIAPDISTKVAKPYQEDLQQQRSELFALQKDFPELFRAFSLRIAKRSALSATTREVDKQFYHGQIGGKAEAHISKLIQHALDNLPALSQPPPTYKPEALLAAIPLFAGLEQKALIKLLECATKITFLAGDAIIGQGERGNALYIIMDGCARIWSEDSKHEEREIAILHAGQFFGEMALLGENIRKANVTAVHPCQLLRITRKHVLEVAEELPEIRQRLHEIKTSRTRMLK
ncbi:MAG: cation:proton antiporter [Mariprofundaceae bacterium]